MRVDSGKISNLAQCSSPCLEPHHLGGRDGWISMSQYQPGLKSEVQDSQNDTVRSCFQKKNYSFFSLLAQKLLKCLSSL